MDKKARNINECRIVGSEISFNMPVPLSKVKEKAKDIWENPEKYSEYKNGSDSSFYSFLKYLWVEFPDGSSRRLCDVAEE